MKISWSTLHNKILFAIPLASSVVILPIMEAAGIGFLILRSETLGRNLYRSIVRVGLLHGTDVALRPDSNPARAVNSLFN